MATNLQFIKSVSATDINEFLITDIFSDAYDVYKIVINKIDTTVQTYNWIRFLDSSGNSISDSEYDRAYLQMTSYQAFQEGKSTGLNAIKDVDSSGTNQSDGIGNVMYIFNPYDSSSYTFLLGQSSGQLSSGLIGIKIIGVHKSAEQITGINYKRGSGNFDNVTVSVYGVK